MAHKGLFAKASRNPTPDMINEAGGKAYAFSAKHALAQYAVTGTFHSTFYASDEAQLDKTLELCGQVSPEFIAKTAVYCRERGYMKDMPAFLAAYLAAHDVKMLSAVFARVIDSGKMLRNFVQIVRSGVVGRKSFGTAPKRLARAWFDKRTPETIFRQSLGNDPSMADVIKLVRPSPKTGKVENGVIEIDPVRQALYGWLIGKSVDESKLPPLVRAFEAFKKGETKVVPQDVPFEMLTALQLSSEQWTDIAKGMSWTQLRMNLNTLARHEVFSGKSGKEMISLVAKKLGDREQIRRARAFPYQLMAAYRAANGELSSELTNALQQAMEIAIENVPQVEGKIFLCPDVSGSMHSAVTGFRKGSTSKVRCVDAAALVSAAFVRRNPTAEVIPFSDDVVQIPKGKLNPYDSVMTNAEVLSTLPSGGTACSAPLRHLNERNEKGDLVVYVSDNESWADFDGRHPAYGKRGGTVMAEEWSKFSARNKNAKLVLIDLQPYAHTQVKEQENVLNVGGFSDRVFEIVALFAKGELGADHWVGEIESIAL